MDGQTLKGTDVIYHHVSLKIHAPVIVPEHLLLLWTFQKLSDTLPGHQQETNSWVKTIL